MGLRSWLKKEALMRRTKWIYNYGSFTAGVSELAKWVGDDEFLTFLKNHSCPSLKVYSIRILQHSSI